MLKIDNQGLFMKNKILTGIALLLPLSFSMAKESEVSQLCLSKPTTEIAQCLADEYAKYDLALNNNYKEIMKNLSANDKKAFKTQQIAWVK